YAMLLQDPTLSEAEKNEYLEKILFNTQRMTALVSNVLTLTKLENKALADSFTEFSLDEQIRQTVVFLEREWDAKELRIDAQLDAVRFCGSESLLPHVWSNLLSNAIVASAPGGCIRLRLLEQTECVVFTVTDEGCGMPREVQERIFDKFYQADPSHNSSGNGLGLPLVKHIVQLCDGIIEVESEEGKGSTFRVILPK
ncbi:MAG: two-component sensor histidine kinase, partial [Oscillospiraceae bacterium]|nr:two-component sensor histidine kinase [Oscillospiraceae bacterium]